MSADAPPSQSARGDAGRPPRVVFYDPIPGDWDFDLERSVLGPAGVELVVPSDPTEAETLIEDADVVIVTGVGRLGADSIARLRAPVGLLCYSIGMNQVDGAAVAAPGHPGAERPGLLRGRGRGPRADAPARDMAAPGAHSGDAARCGLGRRAQGSRHVGQIRRIRGKTLGILGAGRIGARVGVRARGFGLRTIAADPFAPGTPELPVVPLEQMLAEADAIVVCAALTPASRHTLDEAAFRRVRPGTLFVNVSRGGLVDKAALASALRDGRIAFAALDVRDPEPPEPHADPLASLPNVLLTPHVAASSQEAVVDLHLEAAGICLDLLRAAGRLPA